MNYQSSTFGAEENRNKNLWNILKEEISFKSFKWDFDRFFNFYVVQESEQVKL